MNGHDRSPVRINVMSTNTIDTEKTTTPELGAPQAKSKRMAPKKAKPAKKAARAKKPVGKPTADHTNKKTQVIGLMEHAKGATRAEIMKATGWQPHTVRGFVSILGSKVKETIESSKNTAGERKYKIGK
jgi:hypothetical protein